MSEMIVVDDLKFEVRRSLRRKTLGLTVDRGGELVVHSPETASKTELHKWVNRKLLWVHEKLLRKELHSHRVHRLEIVSGECIAYLGRNYRLKIVKNQSTPIQFDGQWFLLRENDRLDAQRHFQTWYQNTGAEWLNERVRFWESKVGMTASKIIVCDLGFRWGSCGKYGALYFNWRLLQLPVFLVDYVVIHELVHLHERNHTPTFWRILGRVLPEWKERKEELSYKKAQMLWCTYGDDANTRIEE
ncbi:putative metal-dependent hydrolase [Dehalogenimonas alkenigignens]|uniref:Putative metal-dependent hydrolase n=1 Tax=Dehalogenimonas alkenigignens TaxID=1217799 RepID=A0A0W0GKS0_9CHLR|nr:SprT family zinc-dependent metalloprotease [Dehalogenimonas alkenigignens]KTB49140.1 putative metal-dependent hydrolase [Dehalogenimonas alkenigignens]